MSAKEFVKYLRRYIIGIIIFSVIAAVGMAVYDLRFKKPIYQAQTTIIISRTNANSSSTTVLNDINASQKLANIYSEIAKSDLTLKQVASELSLNTSTAELSRDLTIKTASDNSILNIIVKNYNAENAANIANKIVSVANTEIKKVYDIGQVTQLSSASVPSKPINNTLMRDLVVAVAIAVFVVVGFAFCRFYLDDSIRRRIVKTSERTTVKYIGVSNDFNGKIADIKKHDVHHGPKKI